MADFQQILGQLQAEAQRLAAHPLAVPVAASLAGLLFVIVLLYSISSKQAKKQRRGTVYEGGVRRSTRQHKQPPKYAPESPAAKTPRAAKTPKTAKKAEPEKEAVTVTPKAATRPRRAAAAKTPATVEPATTRRSTRTAAKTPAK